EMPVAFDASGIATLDWTIPPGAKLGSYEVALRHGDDWTPSGSFRVEQFRIPLMRGDLSMAAVLQPRARAVNVDLSVRHLSGGPAARLPVVLRSELRPGFFAAPEEFESYTFATGPMREGFEHEEEDAGEAAKAHHREEFVLDAAGTTRTVVRDLPVVVRPTDLVVELEFRDPNGETQTVATTRTLLPSARIPGIRVDDWAAARQTLTPHVAVLGPDGQPVADAPVRIDVARRDSYSHRKRLVGGFYGYVHTSEVKKLGLLCEGRSDERGLFHCDAPPPARGNLILEALVVDEAGAEARTRTDVWVPGEEEGFDSGPSDRIDLLPEKKSYEPGETARLQVRMPFREATALVTIEREGIGQARVVAVSGDNPVVEVPVLDEHAPNVYVSVLLVRGRVGDVQPTALLDLGRPAYKLGIAELVVNVKAHRLGVTVTSDRNVYRVRDRARIHVAVRTHDGNAPAAGSEVAVAAVDEGLLELAPNPSWNLLDGMMGRRPYEIETSTAQVEVIGKRHYGRKAAPSGGGGGRSSTRELFDTLLLWAPRVVLDADGEADVEVPLNDSLTAFRIVAVATSGTGRFGTGHTTIRSTRELSVLSGLPPLVREGDEFTAEFTLHNTGDAPLDARISGRVDGLEAPLPEQRFTLAPGEGRIVAWPVRVPAGRTELVYEMTATAGAAGTVIEDKLRVKQRVAAARRVQVTQATLEQVDGSRSFPVRLPAGADPLAAGSGVTVSAAASLADSVDSVKQWLARYPYTCLEQRVSMAVGREDDKAWQAIVDGIDSYMDESGLLRFFPGSDPGDDTLTAYVLSVSMAAGRAFPEELTERMVAGLVGFVSGTVASGRGPVVPDYTLRKLAAVAALARAGKAEPAMLASITIQPALWPVSAVLDWWNIVLTVEIVDRAARLKEVEQVMRSRLDLSGTTLAFTGAQGDLWWMMASGDSDAARLLLLLSEKALWKQDAPRVLRGLVARREGGAWQTTVANAWGVVAMRAFAKAHESEKVTGRTAVELAAVKSAVEWTTAAPPPVVLPWPAGEAELSVVHDGAGKPWITTTARAAVPFTEPVAAGYRVRKTVTAVEPLEAGKWRRSDRLRVVLDIDAQRDMWWVAIDDPIPAGASHLGSGLGRGRISESLPAESAPSQAPSRDKCTQDDCEQASRTMHPVYVERTQESWRAYLRHVPAGHSRVEYMIRLNQPGTFHLPTTRVEALYAPEIFGELPNAIVKVHP
ncbi:MAG: alpha-2-macroglobulin, partial [Candidatus Binatia bacterium]